MRAEFLRPDKPDDILAVVAWDGRGASIRSAEDSVKESLERIFRASPVARESAEPTARTAQGVVEPGDLDWFRTAAVMRGGPENLGVRFVSDTPGGWDPAGAYRSMGAWVAERERSGPDRAP
jgi:hypothetical protein